jgi:L-malate glycosyltransferase
LVFAGFRHDLDRLFPAFTVFCLSSHMEGLGTSLLDAMAFSRAVVATSAGGIPEAVEDGVTGRVVPVRDPAALADALVETLADPVRAAALGAAGRRRFEERFTAERMVDETIAAYDGLR